MKRPTGITILGVIAVIYGIFNLLIALLGLLGIALKVSGVAAAAIKFSAGTLVYATASDAILGIAFLAFGVGALQLRPWGWTAGIIALALEVARQILGLFMQGFGAVTIVRDAVTIVIVVVVLWYLFRPDVRAAFRRPA